MAYQTIVLFFDHLDHFDTTTLAQQMEQVWGKTAFWFCDARGGQNVS